MVKCAIYKNTLVSLPTGLGKTLIAAVVMYNYYRFFPKGLILFTAPTKPLVHQQISACLNIVGLPACDTAEMNGNTNAEKRKELYRARRVFFGTPQTFQKDIENKSFDVKNIVCLVIDEAHRAVGNSAFAMIVQGIKEVSE